MAITIADIARSVGVHPSTVSTVLNKSRSTVRISEKTRQRIVDAAQEMNYRPSFSARALARGKTFSIGMTCGDIHSPHYSELVSHAMREVESHGYHLLLSMTQWVSMENNLDCLQTLMNRGVDGVISWGTGMRTDAPLYQQLVQERFPIVLCAENVGELSSIDIEWDSGMRQAVAYLRDKGHRHVGFVAYAQTDAEIPGNPKLQALQRACDDHGIRCSTHRLTQLSDIDEAERFGMEIAQQNDRPTAFVVYSDYVAFGFMRGLLNRGMRIPQDVAVVGIDGTQMGRVFHPSLTSIALERSQIVVAAVEMVLNMIDKKQQPGQKRVFPTKLMIRESA